jgi:RecB family exonuclease
LPDATALVWRMRFDKAAEAIAGWENDTAAGLVRSLVETRASLDLPLAGLRLTGMADRLDLRRDGTAWIIDYKTGGTPSRKELVSCSIRNWRSKPMPSSMAASPMSAGCRLPGFSISA